jgi:hypothetical protein
MSELPPAPFASCEQATGQVSSQSLVRYQTNDYSVPVAYGHRKSVGNIMHHDDAAALIRDRVVIVGITS